jgi:hypothetical protein
MMTHPLTKMMPRQMQRWLSCFGGWALRQGMIPSAAMSTPSSSQRAAAARARMMIVLVIMMMMMMRRRRSCLRVGVHPAVACLLAGAYLGAKKTTI